MRFFSFTVILFAVLLLPALNNQAVGSPDIGYAILVAGSGEGNQFNVDTNRAYEALISRGFDSTRIHWISSSNCTLNALRSAFNWASVRVGPDSPLIVYFSGHGAPEQFFLNGDAVTPSEAEYPSYQWALDTAEGLGHLPPETPVIIIVDACFSGGFIRTEDVWYNERWWNDLGTISSANRIIITSTHHDELSPSLWGKNLETDCSIFSYELWLHLGEGKNIRQAFIEATEAANAWWRRWRLLGVPYEPWLVDNGDANGHSPWSLGDDGTFAASMTIGTGGEAPSVGEDAPNPSLFDQCYTRNGGSTILGYPINKVHWWYHGHIQDFRGGEAYEGAIMQRYGFDSAFAVYGAIWAKYIVMGGAGGSLGYPVTDENDLPDSSVTGCGCRYNEFEEGAIIYRKPTEDFNDLTVFLGWGIYLKWQDLGYGWYAVGLPVSDEYEATQSGASGFDTTGVACDFEGGHIYWHRTGVYAGQAFEVHFFGSSHIDEVYQDEGGPGGWLGYPVSDTYSNDAGYPQSDFEGGYITTTDYINYQAFALTFLPSVQTNPATSVSSTSAIIHSQIIDDAGSAITERRFDWGSTPSCCDGWTADVSILGDNFSYYLGGLRSGTKYYFRAWAKNEDGWSHGASLSFTTEVAQGCELLADFNTDYIVNFKDFATLASAWMTDPDDAKWNAICDISDPADDVIDVKDLSRLAQYWLLERFPYGITTRVSVSSTGQQANYGSGGNSISADGRYVAFSSAASNLVEGDTNGCSDVFVHDRHTGQTTRVNVSSGGQQGNNNSSASSISADGRYVAFDSHASNLVAGDTNGWPDVFVHDRQTGATTRVSVSSTGQQGNRHSYDPSISADGRYVAFDSRANLVEGGTNWWNVFVHDRQTGQTTRVSVNSAGVQGNDWSGGPSISADGRYIAFKSWASNLVEGDTNGDRDIFVHDRQTGTTSRVSVSSAGQQANDESYYTDISADGRYVAFKSWASNLIEGDTNGGDDIFVHDCHTGETTRVSISSTGQQANENYSSCPSISADGRYVAFDSYASNLVDNDNTGEDVFVHDCQTSETTLVSVNSAGVQGNDSSGWPSISADGRYVAFDSSASNLVEGDTNGYRDVFVHDRFTSSLPDLVIADVNTQPAPPNAADFTTVSIQIKNQGLGDATETFFLEFYFDGTYQGHVYIDGLQAGATHTSNWYGILWPGDTDNYTLKGVVDPDNAITEYIETNNQLSEQFAAPSPPTGTGTLKIQSNPGGANVYIDDEYKGQTPASGYLTITDLTAGDHDLKVTKSGYNDWTDVVIIPSGKTNYEAVILEPSS